ncbi:cytochrome P450 [Streptomyces sp. NPDC002004]
MAAASVPPGPTGRGIGNRPAFERDGLGFLLRQREYGDLVRFDDSLYMVNSPDLAAQVLKHTNSTYAISRDLLGDQVDGSRASEDLARWMSARRVAGRSLNRGGLHALGSRIAVIVARHAEGWCVRGRIEPIGTLEELSACMIAEFCLGPASGAVPALVARLQDARLPGPGAWQGRASGFRRRRLHRAGKELESEVSRLLGQRAMQPHGGSEAVADVLIAACDEGALTREDAVSVVVANLFAAHETTAAALAWLFLLMDRHPGIRRQVEDEVDQVLRGRRPTPADLPDLPITGAVVKETLRLYSPLWYLERTVEAPTMLGGCPLLPGRRVAVSPFVLHRDPRLYDRPQTFRPERWIERSAEALPPGYSYVPFGGGPRMCLGAQFGTTAMVIAVATVVSRYRLREAAGSAPAFDSRTILQPRGLILNVTERRNGRRDR